MTIRGGGVENVRTPARTNGPLYGRRPPNVQLASNYLSLIPAADSQLSQNYVLLQQREGRCLLFAFLAPPSICPALELTMFAAEQERRKRYCNPSNLFISSGTRWSSPNPLSFCLSPTNGARWEMVCGIVESNFLVLGAGCVEHISEQLEREGWASGSGC